MNVNYARQSVLENYIIPAPKQTPPIPAAVRSKAWVCDRSLAGIVGSNPAGGMDVCLLWVLCVSR